MKRVRLGFEVPSALFLYRIIIISAFILWSEMCALLLVLTDMNYWIWLLIFLFPIWLIFLPMNIVIERELQRTRNE